MSGDGGQSTKRSFAGLAPNVVRLGIVSFFADVSSEMLYPLTPLFVTSVLGAPVAAVGLIEGAAEAVASLLKAVSGRIADRTGRRIPLVFGGYTLSAISKPIIALAHVWPTVLLARVSDRVGKGVRGSPRDAVIADSTPAPDRGRAFGWHRSMDTLGAVVGPLLALGLLSVTGERIRLVIALTFIPGMIGALLVLTVRETRREPIDAATLAEQTSWRLLPRPFFVYVAAWAPFVLANSSDVFLILRARQEGFSTTQVVLAYALYNLTYAVGSPVLGGVSDRVGRRRVLIGGLLVFALVYAGFAWAKTATHVWILFAVYGLYMAATDGVGKAYAVDLVPEGVRATAIGVVGMVTGVAALFASVVAGLLWDSVGAGAAFAYGAAGALVSAAVIAAAPQLRRAESHPIT